MLPAPDLRTEYANTFQVGMAKDEVLLTACVSRQEKEQQGLLAMSPANAARLVPVLTRALQQYEEQFGQQTAPTA